MPAKKTKLPKRSAFDQPPADDPHLLRPLTPGNLPELGPSGRSGLRVAVQTKRPRTWEREHQYGKGYSVKGIRPDLKLWLLETANQLGVPVAEVAVYSLKHSMKLVDSGELKIKPSINPRGALMTLFPSGYDESGGDEAQEAIVQLDRKNKSRTARKSARSKAKDKASLKWKTQPVTWTPFDQDLKAKIIEYCRDRVPQGEFVAYLLERARTDYEAGSLVFTPHPKALPGKTTGRPDPGKFL